MSDFPRALTCHLLIFIYSPMGLRCNMLHDPRVAGSEQWWLPHCVLQSNHLDVDIHVDWDGKYNFAHSHYGHPFGKGVEMNDWQGFYDEITQRKNAAVKSSCISSPFVSTSSSSWSSPRFLTEYQRVQIALTMRHEYEDLNKVYKYRPTHKILNEICMLIQTKVFDVKNATVLEIAVDQFDPVNPDHVIVREIAFGKLCSPNDRALALWFNILDGDVEECSAKERLRPKRTERKLLDKKNQDKEKIIKPVAPAKVTYAQIIGKSNNRVTRYVPTSFDDDHPSMEKQIHIFCPKDEISHKLVSAIMKHRLDVLHKNSFEQTDSSIHGEEFKRLEQIFISIQRHFSTFHWPVNEGRKEVDENTLIPAVDTKYEVPNDGNGNHHGLWNSFVDTTSAGFNEEKYCEEARTDEKRFSVFKTLSKGQTPCGGM